jgi:hypothetical protein
MLRKHAAKILQQRLGHSADLATPKSVAGVAASDSTAGLSTHVSQRELRGEGT